MESSILLMGLSPEAEAALTHTLDELRLRRVNDPAQRPAVAIISLETDTVPRTQLIQNLSTGGTRVAAVAQRNDAELILAAMRAGAREFVLSSDRAALENVVQNLARPASGAVAGTLTAVFSAKGGLGATSVAANLAGALAARGERVCLVDLDLELGDVCSVLDLHSSYSIADVIENMRRLDEKLLDASIVRHRSGIAVLARGERLDETGRVDAESLARLFAFLRQHYAHVVVDGLHGFGDLTLTALDASDRVILLVTQEVPAVRNAQRCVEIFRRLGYPDEKVKLVVNRYQKGSRITKEVVQETTGVPVSATVANDFALLSRSVNRGNLLAEEAPKSVIARDIDSLTGLLGATGAEPARASLLARWLNPRGALAHGA